METKLSKSEIIELNTDLRQLVQKKCMLQKNIALEIGVSNIHLNYWLKENKDFGPDSLKKVQKWLEN